MARIIFGARGAVWQGADWVARNAFEFLIPQLRAAGDDALADRCRTEIAYAAHVVDLADVLCNDRAAAAWRNAAAAAASCAEREVAQTWNEPHRKPELIAALRLLETLVPGGGHAVVIDLAAAVQKKL